MFDRDELDRLTAALPRIPLDDPRELANAGRVLGIEWPSDYVEVITRHDGAEGDVGPFGLVLYRADELIERNRHEAMESFPGLVMIGGDGGLEALAIDRATGEVLLVPWVGGEEDWLVLGSTLTEALQRLERDEAFDAPNRPRGDGLA